MATFVLVPGAGGIAWYWHRVVPLLIEAGHGASAVELPGDDERVGLDAYASRVVDAIGGARDPVVVAQSLAGFTAPLVCERVRVQALAFVNAMIPEPGETAGEWGRHTGSSQARAAAARQGGYSEDFDDATYFFHDLAPDVAAGLEQRHRRQAERAMGEPCRFERWPDIPIHVIAGRDDRLFPLELQRRVAKQRLGVSVDVVPGGHLAALSHPRELADRLVGYVR